MWIKLFQNRLCLNVSLTIGSIFLLGFFACSKKEPQLFTTVPSNETGIFFQNKVESSDSINILQYLYFYNGGGVAIGDINNDGLQDVYFSSNRGENKLYLNKGSFQFEDITQQAGVGGKGNWKTGVTMADVNGDGLLDIYVCEVGKYANLIGKNELFINNGNLTFTEKATDYGLDVEGFNTQASFFDYDKDGDLDMFLVNHSVHSTESYSDASMRFSHNDVSGDKLFRNDKQGEDIHFTEVTSSAGIYNSIIGYGLSVIIGDFNNDNWDDIYVSNDFHENDYYYINNQNGTFSEKAKLAFGHQSRFSMGSDAADINNDGWLDIVTLDMLPADEKVLKSSVGEDPLDIYDFKMAKGYHHQYSRNCLQLNIDGGNRFSDIALFSGISATDWSWSPLMADFNNDGIKDLFITNGIAKRPNDLDYLKFISGQSFQKNSSIPDQKILNQMPEGKMHNYIFEGSANLKFKDKSFDWGFNEPTLSNGAAYADLDNDGDLDLVINNMNALAGIYRNNAEQKSRYHFLNIQLLNRNGNTAALGGKVILFSNGGKQVNYVTATRGFQSASSNILHFGLGEQTEIDSFKIIWPDNTVQLLQNVVADQLLKVVQNNTTPYKVDLTDNPLLENVTEEIKLDFRHSENLYVDFNYDQLMLHEISTEGPKLAVADINGDGFDDLYVCGAKGQPGALFQQMKNGKFISTNKSVFAADAYSEGVDATFFDADGDGDKDLYVVSGGNEANGKDSSLLDHLYINDGKGNFLASSLLPQFWGNKSVVCAADYDKDGDEDLFIGGRSVAGSYGIKPTSFLLENKGNGTFVISTQMPPDLQQVGMVTDALWSDYNKDGWMDLIVVGEWMPITIFINEKGKLSNATEKLQLQNSTGLWSSIYAFDMDNDGFDDYLAGNLGLNSKLHASVKHPLYMYVGDVDNNGRIDQILATEKEGAYYPFLQKEDIEKSIPSVIRKKYLGYSDMAGVTVDEIFGDKLSLFKKLSVQTLASVLVKNNRGTLHIQNLDGAGQWSPLAAFLSDDINNDGKPDVISAGNFYGVIPYEGRYDAGFGNVFIQHKDQLKSIPTLQSGLRLEGEIRDIKKLKTAQGNTVYVIARNNTALQFYRKKN